MVDINISSNINYFGNVTCLDCESLIRKIWLTLLLYKTLLKMCSTHASNRCANREVASSLKNELQYYTKYVFFIFLTFNKPYGYIYVKCFKLNWLYQDY